MDLFDYSEIIDNSMMKMFKDILQHVKTNGFPSEHHLYITFDTNFPGSKIPETLQAKYPKEMTIVLQHQYYDLTIEKEFFSVKLSFAGTLELIRIPFDSIIFIHDPFVDFSFSFIKKEAGTINQNKITTDKKTKIRKLEFNRED